MRTRRVGIVVMCLCCLAGIPSQASAQDDAEAPGSLEENGSRLGVSWMAPIARVTPIDESGTNFSSIRIEYHRMEYLAAWVSMRSRWYTCIQDCPRFRATSLSLGALGMGPGLGPLRPYGIGGVGVYPLQGRQAEWIWVTGVGAELNVTDWFRPRIEFVSEDRTWGGVAGLAIVF